MPHLQFAEMFGARLLKAWVTQEKLHDFPVSGACWAMENHDVPLRQWPQPRPLLAERAPRPRDDSGEQLGGLSGSGVKPFGAGGGR